MDVNCVTVEAGSNPHCEFMSLAEWQWREDTRLHTVFTSFGSYFDNFVSLIKDTQRTEALIRDSNGLLVGGAILQVVQDAHWEEVIIPAVCYVHKNYRNSLAVNHCIHEAYRYTSRRSGVSFYQTVKHVGTTRTETTTRKMKL